MKEYIVHLRRRLLIRPNNVKGLEDFMCMDKINNRYRHDSEMLSEEGLTMDELLDKYRGTGSGRASIPEDNWVKVQVEEGSTLEQVFDEAQKQKKEKNFV